MTITCGASITVLPTLLTQQDCCYTNADMDQKLQEMNDLILKWSLGIGLFAGALTGIIAAIFGIVAGTGVATLLPGVGAIAAILLNLGIASGLMGTMIATMIVSGGISVVVLFILKALCVAAGTCKCVEARGMCLATLNTRILWFWVEVPFWIPLPGRCSTILPNCP